MNGHSSAIPLFDVPAAVDVALPSEVTDRINHVANGCWEWRGSTQGKGYPQVWIGDEWHYAAHYVFERLVGTIQGRQNLWRQCGNVLCVNPAHMNPGSPNIGPVKTPYTITYYEYEGAYKATHERHKAADVVGWGETPDEAVIELESEIEWHQWLS